LAWRRDLRSMQRYISEYTRGLRSTIRPGTEHEWTDEERGTEWKRLWRDGCVKLVLGRVGEGADATLRLIKHPIALPPGAPGSTRKTAWVPPGKGHVAPDSMAFRILDSLIHDPAWDNKFPALIDGRLTFCNESYFHVLRKWDTKHSHFYHYYATGIWCSLLSWNENVTRPTLEEVWKRHKSGQLASSAGRWYKVAIRAPKTDDWRYDVWLEYKTTLKPQQLRSSASAAPAPAPATSYWLGWCGTDPPHPPPRVPPAPPGA